MDHVAYEQVRTADLVVDQVYRGGTGGKGLQYEPLTRMFDVGNAEGFRVSGSVVKDQVRLVVIYTSLAESDWPDELDGELGVFRYYGDNRRPGRELHDTHKRGNLLLSRLFDRATTVDGRRSVPPILLFSKTRGLDRAFRGMLVPGAPVATPDEQLVAVWRSTDGRRFQNYKALFSVLDTRSVSRAWIDSVLGGRPDDALAPVAWRDWVRTGIPSRLLAPRTVQIRTREEQTPSSASDRRLLTMVHEHFRDDPYAFEGCASEIWKLVAPATDELEQTRRSRDGGRDAVGTYRIGPVSDPISIDFALEAKCYAPDNSVGVRETSRLISRLRHRNFGVLVTTSFVNKQAYEELRADRHPVVVVSGADIVATLKAHGRGSPAAVRHWLDTQYPRAAGGAGAVRADVAYLKPDQVSDEASGARLAEDA